MSQSRRLTRERVLIVGAGRAGVSAAEELRRSGFQGDVVVFGDEPGLPYYRPACSKGVLTGSKRPSDLRLDLRGCVDVQWHMGRRVMSLNPVDRVVETDDGRVHAYDGLVIASGSQAVTMPKEYAGLHQLQGIEDAWALRQALRDAHRVAVIGGGLTGCETAWAVRSLARECVLVDASRYVMARAVGRHAARAITEQLSLDGVEMYLGRRVMGMERGRQGRWWLTLDDDTEIDADVVAYAGGALPNTSWLEGAAGLDISDGVLCDESLRVVGAEAIVAAGDVARWPNLRTGTEARRSALWTSALQHGRAAARALLAGDEPVPPVTPLQQMWSEQFGLRIQAAGEIGEPGTKVKLAALRPGRRNVARSGVLVNYTREDRLSGVVAINAPRIYAALVRSMLVAPHSVLAPMLTRESAAVADLRDLLAPEDRRRPAHIITSGLPERPASDRQPVSQPGELRSAVVPVTPRVVPQPSERRSAVVPVTPRVVPQPSEQRSAVVPVAKVVRPASAGSSARAGYQAQPAERPAEPVTPDSESWEAAEADSASGTRPTISVSRPESGEEPVSWAYS